MRKHHILGEPRAKRIEAVFVSLAALIAGFFYYGAYRGLPVAGFIPGFDALSLAIFNVFPSGAKVNWLPTFLHAFSTFLLTYCLLLKQSDMVRKRYRLVIMGLLILIECVFGVMDWFDIGAIVVAAITAELVASVFNLTSGNSAELKAELFLHDSRPGSLSFPVLALLGMSALLAGGSYYPAGVGNVSDCNRFENGNCVEFTRSATPVFMSFQELRSSVALEEPRTPENLGRVYLYQNYVLLNERNQGIHIFDNSDPVSPVNLGFIKVPGNTDIAMRDNYLYADSYVDLVTLDLNDPMNVSVISRQENLFPFDPYQNVPSDIFFPFGSTNEQDGVVVSYRLSGS